MFQATNRHNIYPIFRPPVSIFSGCGQNFYKFGNLARFYSVIWRNKLSLLIPDPPVPHRTKSFIHRPIPTLILIPCSAPVISGFFIPASDITIKESQFVASCFCRKFTEITKRPCRIHNPFPALVHQTIGITHQQTIHSEFTKKGIGQL